jgi:hypothetical protein
MYRVLCGVSMLTHFLIIALVLAAMATIKNAWAKHRADGKRSRWRLGVPIVALLDAGFFDAHGRRLRRRTLLLLALAVVCGFANIQLIETWLSGPPGSGACWISH